jgi:23S rRNA (guanosine2251-2'-O)-methyltransferase
LRKENLSVDPSLFEGMVSVRAVIRSLERERNGGLPARRIERIYYDRAKEEKTPKELAWLRRRADEFGFRIELVPREVIDAAAIGASHGGVLAFCADREFITLSADVLPEDGLFFMIDGIEDPYNYGYAIRSIYAAGADGLILSPRSWMTAAGTVCRASAGASELIPMYLCPEARILGEDGILRDVPDDREALRLMKKAGYKAVGADIEDSVSVWDASLTRPLLLVVGGEKRGIKKRLRPELDLIVRLDYGREFGEALSAASAASVLAFEALRQNRK